MYPIFFIIYASYYYVLCNTIYYILLLFFISYIIHLYLYTPKMERIIKKNTFIFILIYFYNLFFLFFICRNKIYTLKFYQITLFLCIYELCDLLNPSHLTYTLSPFLRSTFSTRYTSG